MHGPAGHACTCATHNVAHNVMLMMMMTRHASACCARWDATNILLNVIDVV